MNTNSRRRTTMITRKTSWLRLICLIVTTLPQVTAFSALETIDLSRRTSPDRKRVSKEGIVRISPLFAVIDNSDKEEGTSPSSSNSMEALGKSSKRSDKNVGGYDPSEKITTKEINVGDPQIKVIEKERSVTSILRELAAIQQQGPQKYCILGTRHCSFLHQQIIELLAYALVLSGNHVYTSGAGGTHAATIRGALRAERPDLLTVVLPQSRSKQTKESQQLLKDVEDVIEMPQNDEMSLDVASRICNSYILSQTDQLISFAFHESTTVIEATNEAKKLDMLVTVLYLD